MTQVTTVTSNKNNENPKSPRDIQFKMSDEITTNATQSILQAEISATANAEAKNKTAIWADKIETESLIILESMMENY